MNADGFRQLYDYYFALNHKLWYHCVAHLSEAQFTQELDYSVGSVRNQLVHAMSVDERWFSGLSGIAVPDFLEPVDFSAMADIRTRWDAIEAMMQSYLDGLTDDMLQQPFTEQLQVWQVLFHVLNHGTDHRAQTLAILNRLDIPGFPQDYALYVFGRI